MFKIFAVLAAAVSFASGQSRTVDAVHADAVFAKLKNMAGEWEEKSTKGWTGSTRVRVIARGSAVLFDSAFTDSPEAGMATLLYLDNGRLLLTHYCEARNQPTLVASSESPDGSTVTFTFLSGTGMKSRNDGHMDKVVMKFSSGDSYTDQWTWFSGGKEQWLEEIEHRRIRKDASAPAGR